MSRNNAALDLTYLLVGKNNKYLQKRNGIRLSSDPFNNSGRATKRHSFLNTKGAGVRINKNTVYVAVNDGSNFNKPRKQWKKQEIKEVSASTASRVAAAVRPDLADITFRKARKLQAAAKRSAVVKAKRAQASGNKTFKKKTRRGGGAQVAGGGAAVN